MKKSRVGRREFVRGLAGSAAAIAALPSPGFGTPLPRQTAPKIKFGVVGINHGHINGQVDAVQRGGGELVSMYAKEPDLVAEFVKRHPNVKVARSEAEVLEDKSLQLVVSASIPDERGAARRSRHEARQGLPGRQAGDHDARRSSPRCARCRPRRSASTRSCTASGSRTARRCKAGELVQAGAIGRVVQTIGMGPHRTQPQDAAGVVLRARALRRHPLRHRLAPGRSVSLFHRLDERRRGCLASREPQSPAVSRGSRTSAT